MERFKYIISWISWPGLMAICLGISIYGFSIGHPIITFNIAYVFIIVSLVLLERWMPHEKNWLSNDGQTFANVAHTLTSKGTVQVLLIFSGALGLAELIKPVSEPGYSIWPRDWPMWAQASLGIVAAEFGLYWAHRISHEWPVVWRLHAIHHSVRRLWVINTGRFHFMDSVWKILLGMAVLLSLGAPYEVVQWTSIITAYIGVLTHCNVEMRFGWISYIFNTPEVHRWHHSMNLDEGDMNYGENVVIWDIVFGTFYNKKHKRPPSFIGVPEYMPPLFRHQLLWPFLTMKQRADVQARYPDDSRTPAAVALAKIT